MCEKFSRYENEKNTNTVILEDEEVREKRQLVRDVLYYVTNWSKSEFFINDDRVSDKESFIFSPNGKLLAHWLGNNCYDEYNHIIMTRKIMQ